MSAFVVDYSNPPFRLFSGFASRFAFLRPLCACHWWPHSLRKMVCVQFASVEEKERELRWTPELSACLRKQNVSSSTPKSSLSSEPDTLFVYLNKLRKKLLVWYFALPLNTRRCPQELELQCFKSKPFIKVETTSTRMFEKCVFSGCYCSHLKHGWRFVFLITWLKVLLWYEAYILRKFVCFLVACFLHWDVFSVSLLAVYLQLFHTYCCADCTTDPQILNYASYTFTSMWDLF